MKLTKVQALGLFGLGFIIGFYCPRVVKKSNPLNGYYLYAYRKDKLIFIWAISREFPYFEDQGDFKFDRFKITRTPDEEEPK